MLIYAGTVKLRQAVSVLGKMRRYPVQNDADLILVQIVHQILEILRRSIPGCGRVIPRHLITPGGVQRMLRNAHQFHMGVAHPLHILRQGMGKLPVSVKSVGIRLRSRMLSPGAGMHLIDGQRLLFGIRLFSLFHPVGVAPDKFRDIRHPGGSSRSHLRPVGIWIRLVDLPPIHSADTELVQVPQLCSGHKNLPDTNGAHFLHRIRAVLPFVEIPHHRNRLSVWGPYGKIDSLLSVPGSQMRPQLFINIVMGRLAKQILIQLSKMHHSLHKSFSFLLSAVWP